MDIENLAVSELNIRLGRCPQLKAYVTVNDKTPFIDGHVELYEGLVLDKPHWRGRVPVQVKGRTRHGKPKPTLKFSVTRVDMLAFQRDSGVLYFVVTVDSDSAKGTVYYFNLSPAAIEWKLRSIPNDQASISLSFNRLPDDPKQIQRVVALALKTREQSATLGFDSAVFEQMQSITLHMAAGLDLSAPITLTPGDTDFALVVNTKEGMAVPLLGEISIFPSDYEQRITGTSISSGQIVYETATVRQVGEQNVEVKLADGLSLTLRRGGSGITGSVVLTLGGSSIGERIKAIEFYLSLVRSSTISIGGEEAHFEASGHKNDKELRSHLKALNEFEDLLDALGLDPSIIDLDQIDESQNRGIRVLYKVFVLRQEIDDVSIHVSRIVQKFAQWNVMLIVLPGSVTGSWRIVNPFDPSTRQQFRMAVDDGSHDDTIVTAYDGIDVEVLRSVINLRLDHIVDAYESIRDYSTTAAVANQQVLSLISAADSGATRRYEFLHAADELAAWLIRSYGGEPIHLVNRWQIKWRRQELSAEARSEIRGLRRRATSGKVDNAAVIEVACALLLGDLDEVDELILNLDPQRLATLRDWPIWKLHETAVDK